MEPVGWKTYVVLLLFCVGSIVSEEDTGGLIQRLENTEKMVKALSDRVGLLESRETVHLTRISYLESRDLEQQETIEELKQQLQKQEQMMESSETILQQQNKDTTRVPTIKQLLGNNNGVHKAQGKHKERSVQRIRQASVDTPIAFYVGLGNHLEHAGIKQVIIFDNEITNIGNAYNTNSGVFTAPVDGIYVFSTTLFSRYHVSAHASIYKNSISLNTMFLSAAESGWDTSSATVTIYLLQGDIITVKNGDSNVSIHGYNHSIFTGFLLTEYSSGVNIVG